MIVLVAAGNQARGAIGFGEIAQRPYRVHGQRGARTGQCQLLGVLVQRLGCLPGAHGQGAERRKQQLPIQQRLAQRQHRRL